jgi:histone deacetylase 1/2
LLRMSCPYTSAQNGRVELIIWTTNNIVRSLLFQASLPPSYWVEALATATHVLNLLPTKTLPVGSPHSTLFGTESYYEHLRVFGWKCYPNLSATATHNLSLRSALCVFLGYSTHHKGYCCLDLSSNKIIISRHVTFDEHNFPFAENSSPNTPNAYEFLNVPPDPVSPIPIRSAQSFVPAGHSGGASLTPALPHVASGSSPALLRAASCASPALPRAASTVSPAQPCAASGVSPALPRAAPGAPSTLAVSPLRAPVVPPGFAPLPVHTRNF